MKIDPFLINDLDFKKKYRFNKKTIKKIANLIREDIALDTRGGGTSAELQVLVALRCWGRREVSIFFSCNKCILKTVTKYIFSFRMMQETFMEFPNQQLAESVHGLLGP